MSVDILAYLSAEGRLDIGSKGVTIDGDCRMIAGGSCLVSPNFPDNYPDNSQCVITGVPRVPLVVAAFETEPGYDKVMVNGIGYSGSGVEFGPSEVVPEDGIIRWSADGTIRRTGWALCWASLPPAPPAPPPSPPSPSPAPLYPPLPEQFEVGAEMCAVIDTPPDQFDALKFRTGIAQAFKIFRPHVYGLRVGSCNLVKSSLCSEPSAVFYAPEGTVIDSNRSTIRAADALLTTVVSLSLIVLTSDFDDGGSAVGDVCDMLTDTMCTAFSPEDPSGYNECFTARTLREMLCFACPVMSNVGLFGESLRLVADATGSNISFATFRLEERPLPWSPNDIAWFALWLVPVWMLFLIPIALLARWLLRPRDTVRRELAAALDRVEEEDVRRRFAEPDVSKAVRDSRWLGCTLVLLGLLLLPWAPSFFLLLAAVPVARKTSAKDWVFTKQAWRRCWLNCAIATCLLHAPWSLASWGLTRWHGEVEPDGLTTSTDKSSGVVLSWFCRQLIGGGTNAVGAVVQGGVVCDAFDRLFPPTTLILPWVLLGQGCACLLAAPLALALLLRTVGQGTRELRRASMSGELLPDQVGPLLIRLSLYASLLLCLASPPAGLAGFQSTRLWFAPIGRPLALRPLLRRPGTGVDSVGVAATMYNWAVGGAVLAALSAWGYLQLGAVSVSDSEAMDGIENHSIGRGLAVLMMVAVAMLCVQVLLLLAYAWRLRSAVGRHTDLGMTCSGWWFMVPACLPCSRTKPKPFFPPSIDALLCGDAVATPGAAARFAGQANDLISGQPKEAATGIYGFIGYGEAELRSRCLGGTAAIIQEVEELGDTCVLENLNYVLYQEAGSSEAAFQNGWRRDCAPDGSTLPHRHGMRLADFARLPVARRGMLEEAHVVALRLYSTSAFVVLNLPMRNLKMRTDSRGFRVPREPPQLAAPHPLPVTMAFIYEGLKRLRAVNAMSQIQSGSNMFASFSMGSQPSARRGAHGDHSTPAGGMVSEEGSIPAGGGDLRPPAPLDSLVAPEPPLLDPAAVGDIEGGPASGGACAYQTGGGGAAGATGEARTGVASVDASVDASMDASVDAPVLAGGVAPNLPLGDIPDAPPVAPASLPLPDRMRGLPTDAPPASCGGGSARGSYRGGPHSSRWSRAEVAPQMAAVEMAASEWDAACSPGSSLPATPRGGKDTDGGRASARVVGALRQVRRLPGVSSLVRVVSGAHPADGNKEQTILWRGMGNMRVTERFLLLGGTEVRAPGWRPGAFTPPWGAFTPPWGAFTPPSGAFTPPLGAFTPLLGAFIPSCATA